MSRYAGLLTEGRNPRSRRLDALPLARVVELLLDEDRRALAAAFRCRGAIARAARLAAASLEAGGSLLFAGAGTSGRLGVLEAAECPPTFGTRPSQVRAAMAGGPGAVLGPVEGAEDDPAAGRRAASRLRPRDLLVGVSASSLTPFVRGALREARRRGARSVLVTCAPGRGLGGLADVVVGIPTGPELLAGSTRLKAGSATKAALNAITTAAMVRLGKAYGPLMVDVRPTNAKLRDRARRIVAEAAGVDARAAARALHATGAEVKTAILVARLGVSPREARRILRAAAGRLRPALLRRVVRAGSGR